MIKQTIKVEWNNAVIYNVDSEKSGLHRMVTTGILYKRSDDYLVIKNPETYSLDKDEKHPEKDVGYYYIPMGMIVSEETLD